ncbi:MAG: preprotein translocase subunit SecE [Deltaproteobacteria bacterium RBG_13_65_10]|nr:MAG: preprotein translocase subunit SecE [Deltaproteobacteria bacterium RBG_13_65_10]
MLPQVEKTQQFLKEVRVETKKVTWPTVQESVGATWVVVIVVAIVALFLFGVDFILARVINLLVG